VLRLSGTGTEGATLRIYFERYRQDGGRGDVEEALAPLVQGVRELLSLRERFGVEEPTVIT
jgi:phosphoglucomutase